MDQANQPLNPISDVTVQEFPKVHWIKRPFIWLKSLVALLFHCVIWCFLEVAYYWRLFLYTTRRFLHVEVYLALLGAFLFFGWIVHNDMATYQRDLLEYCYLYFTVVMVILAMNLLPRERDEETLEILWSQPIRRSTLVVIQLVTLTVWLTVLCAVVIAFFSRYSAYVEGRWMILLMVVTTSFTVGAITILISTFCRHGIATGLVALLLFGIHYTWIQELGPIDLYVNPILWPGAKAPQGATYNLIFNRIMMLAMTGFVLDYLFRRLKRSAEWFT